MNDVAAPEDIAGRIRQLRTELGWSAQQLADECAKLGHPALNRSTIAKIESGVRKSVTAAELDVLGRALGVELTTLVRGSDVASLMAMLYFDEAAAMSVLTEIGFPVHLIPPFRSAAEFWRQVIRDLYNGVILDGIPALTAATASRYPGNAEIKAMYAKWSDQPPTVTTSAGGSSPGESYPTLTLVGADLPDAFLRVIRDQIGSDEADLLYISKQQCAVQIPDPGDGDNAARLQEQVQEIMQAYAPGAGLQVKYEKYKFRPSLYSSLTVFGPDTSPFLLQSVPNTMTPADITAAVVGESRVLAGSRSGTVSTVIDVETDTGLERLNPGKTLHESKVNDSGTLRVTTEALAGGPTATPGHGTPAQEAPFTVRSSREVADSASRSSGGFRRREYMREAERLIVEGDSDRSDKNVYLIGGKERAKLSRLATQLVETVRDAFVNPRGYDQLLERCAKTSTVILRGPAGYGKQGTAMRILLDLGAKPLFQLDPRVDLTRLADSIDTIEQGAGYILMQPDSFTTLHGSVLRSLDEALNRARARLVITADSAVTLPDQDLHAYVAEVPSAPDYSAITQRRLAYRVGTGPAQRLLARPDIRKEIGQQLAAKPSCMLAADLADAIAEEADRAGSAQALDLARIQAWQSRRGAEDFDIWFASLGNTRARSFAIALAVLNGLPYDDVAKAARALNRKFSAPPYMVMSKSEDLLPEEDRPFLIPRREWMYRLRARITETQVRGAYGLSYAEAAEYRDPEYAPKVMARAFADYQAQDSVLDWLDDLTQDASEQVRIYAATALGKLTAQSFDYLSRNVLARWADSDQESRRDAVAYALRTVITIDPRLDVNVRVMVTAWYANREAPNQQATAARVYGVAYGRTDPAASFTALNRLTVVNNTAVAIAIGDSLADLLADSSDDLTSQVLAGLAESARDRERSPAAQLAFLVLAAPLDKEVPASDLDSRAASWPLLLYLMARLRAARPSIVALWRTVLNDGLLPSLTEAIMTRWAIAAETGPDIQQAFLRTVRAVAAGDQRCGMILSRFAATWVSQQNLQPLPAVGAAMQALRR